MFNGAAGGDAQIVSPLAGAPGFVKAAAAATPAVPVPTAGPLASVAEHTNAAASARENGTSASSPGRSSGLAEAAAMQDAGHSAGNGSGLAVATARTAGLSLDSQDGPPGAGASDGLSGLADPSQTQPAPGPSTSSGGGGGGAAGLLSRYSMLGALPLGGVDRSGAGGPPSLGRDSMPAAFSIQVTDRKVMHPGRRSFS